LDENINTISKNRKALLEASREAEIKVNMIMSCHQNAGQNHTLLTANKSVDAVAKLTYLETAATNCIHQEIKSRLNSGNAYYLPFRSGSFVFQKLND